MLASFSTQTNFWLEIGCAASILLAALYQSKATARLTMLTHDSSEGIWRLTHTGEQKTTGKLICAGYRGASL
ncbi:MAG: hypothetical protein ACJAZF_002452, partial [Granulosicoccus sp.]